ncbi:MAG: hypothetical protein IKV32_04340 [Muribaculaceae bacterium]|nr:hypothetical protein [Muribaculaceae bacterium]
MKTIKTLGLFSLLILSIGTTSCNADEPIPPKKEPTIDEYGIAIDQEVDLGLPSGTIWAGWNLGATAPEEFGDYYACGETETKAEYSLSNYSHWFDKNEDGYLTANPVYCEFIDIGSNISGTKYDVARLNWKGKWRIPTYEEFKELISYCTWTWIYYKDSYGYKVTGLNGVSIFLPFAGYISGTTFYPIRGRYWSSTINEINRYGIELCFDFNNFFDLCQTSYRHGGCSIRPVK